MAAADFFLRTVQVPADAWLGLNDSASVPALYAGGAVQYWVYEPSTAAELSIGVTPNTPKPLFFAISTLSSNLTALGANEGLNMTDGGLLISSKLGFGAANNGSAKLTPGGGNQTWPLLTIFPQMPNAWTPAISGAATRASWMVLDAIYRDVCATYNIDQTRVYGSGVSGNGGVLQEYCMAKHKEPRHFKIRFAAIIACAGTVSGSGWRQDFPSAIQGENSTNQTFPKMSRYITREMDLHSWDFHSTNDAQSSPAFYNPLWDPAKIWAPTPLTDAITVGGGASAGILRKHGAYARFTEYTTGTAPAHGSVWDYAYGNNTVGGALNHTDELWAWMLSKRYTPGATNFGADQLWIDLSGPPAPPPATSTPIRRGFVGAGIR